MLTFAKYVSAQTEEGCFGNGGAVGSVNEDTDMTNLQLLIREFDFN